MIYNCNTRNEAAQGAGQKIVLFPYVWSQKVQAGKPNAAFPTLVAPIAVPALVTPDGRLAPDLEFFPYVPSRLMKNIK